MIEGVQATAKAQSQSCYEALINKQVPSPLYLLLISIMTIHSKIGWVADLLAPVQGHKTSRDRC
jgi:hypothetical protein